MYITSEAVTTGIKVHEEQHQQMNELLGKKNYIYAGNQILPKYQSIEFLCQPFYLQIEGSENIAGFQLELVDFVCCCSAIDSNRRRRTSKPLSLIMKCLFSFK